MEFGLGEFLAGLTLTLETLTLDAEGTDTIAQTKQIHTGLNILKDASVKL